MKKIKVIDNVAGNYRDAIVPRRHGQFARLFEEIDRVLKTPQTTDGYYKKAGNIVKYRVPILDDYYKKLIWTRPTVYRSCKLIPLRYTKEIINKH